MSEVDPKIASKYDRINSRRAERSANKPTVNIPAPEVKTVVAKKKPTIPAKPAAEIDL